MYTGSSISDAGVEGSVAGVKLPDGTLDSVVVQRAKDPEVDDVRERVE